MQVVCRLYTSLLSFIQFSSDCVWQNKLLKHNHLFYSAPLSIYLFMSLYVRLPVFLPGINTNYQEKHYYHRHRIHSHTMCTISTPWGVFPPHGHPKGIWQLLSWLWSGKCRLMPCQRTLVPCLESTPQPKVHFKSSQVNYKTSINIQMNEFEWKDSPWQLHTSHPASPCHWIDLKTKYNVQYMQ